ncbi:hypothetical protein JTB14_016897 [Gonioctena quinquepunctata]|nr:hypothetical protein JTB14_016897 [Gonioctena quinquepunctata]
MLTFKTQNTKDAKEAWDNLAAAFQDSGLTRRVGLLRTLITVTLEKTIGLTVSDEWIGTTLLAGLPKSYKPMIMGIENSGVKEPTAQTRKDSEKADSEERNEMDISEPENGSSNGYVDVISDVDGNQNDSDYLPEMELGEENAPPVQRNQRVRRAPEAMKDYEFFVTSLYIINFS